MLTGNDIEEKGESRRRISRRDFLKKVGDVTLGAYFLGSAGLFYSRDFETNWIELKHLRLSLPNLPEQFAGYRVVQISDIHLDGATKPGYMDEVVWLINEQEPDLVVSTGDYVTSAPERFAPKLT